MSIQTHNFKVPGSLYHLKDSLIIRIIRASEHKCLTVLDITTMLENAGAETRRTAKTLAGRVNPSELSSLHREFHLLKSSNSVSVSEVCYSRERNYVTIRYEQN